MIINKVIVSWQEPENMEKINKATGLEYDKTDNWCDIETIQNCQLEEYLDVDQLKAMLKEEADYIAFRIDY